jgi:hypothetical protein
MEQILTAVQQITDQLEQVQWGGIQPADRHELPQGSLSDAFVLSVKSAARSGLTFEG